jgi:hypothetical protein
MPSSVILPVDKVCWNLVIRGGLVTTTRGFEGSVRALVACLRGSDLDVAICTYVETASGGLSSTPPLHDCLRGSSSYPPFHRMTSARTRMS